MARAVSPAGAERVGRVIIELNRIVRSCWKATQDMAGRAEGFHLTVITMMCSIKQIVATPEHKRRSASTFGVYGLWGCVHR